MKQKAEKRDKELTEFKQKTSTQDDLHKQLLEIDKKTKLKQSMKQASPLKDGLDEEDHSEQPVDKRLEIYKRMRQDLL